MKEPSDDVIKTPPCADYERLRNLLDYIRAGLADRFGHADAPYTPWALEMIATIDSALGDEWAGGGLSITYPDQSDGSSCGVTE